MSDNVWEERCPPKVGVWDGLNLYSCVVGQNLQSHNASVAPTDWSLKMSPSATNHTQICQGKIQLSQIILL